MVLSPQSYTVSGTQMQPNCCCPRRYYDWYTCSACQDKVDTFGQRVPKRLAFTVTHAINATGNGTIPGQFPLCLFCQRVNRTFICDYWTSFTTDPEGENRRHCTYRSPLLAPGACSTDPLVPGSIADSMWCLLDINGPSSIGPTKVDVQIQYGDYTAPLGNYLISGSYLHTGLMRCNDTVDLGPSELYPREVAMRGAQSVVRLCNGHWNGSQFVGDLTATGFIELVTK